MTPSYGGCVEMKWSGSRYDYKGEIAVYCTQMSAGGRQEEITTSWSRVLQISSLV